MQTHLVWNIFAKIFWKPIMTKSDQDSIDIIQRVIRKPVSSENCEQIHGALAVGVRDNMLRPLLVPKFLELANYHQKSGDLAHAIEVIHEAYNFSPTDLHIIHNLGFFLCSYIEGYSDSFCDQDIIWLREFLRRLDDEAIEQGIYDYERKAIIGLSEFRRSLNQLSLKNDTQTESKHTVFLSNLTLKQFRNLSPEERQKKAAEILARKLWERYRKSNSQTNNNNSEDNDA
jgi:hypothetical protein